MGKIRGSKWLAAFKRVFRSPNQNTSKKTSRRAANQRLEDEEEQKKRGKRRWIFNKKGTEETTTVIHDYCANNGNTIREAEEEDEKVAMAMASTTPPNSLFLKQHISAISIQTAFRGYLGRRALVALKGLVKLQALVRGHNVRKRAKMTFHCMQALMRVQDRVLREQRNNWLHSNYLRDPHLELQDDGQPFQDIQVMLEYNNNIDFKSENSLSHAFSHKIWRPSRETYASEGEAEEKPKPKPKWMKRSLAKDPIKIVEMDTSSSHPYINDFSTPKSNLYQSHHRLSSYSPATPFAVDQPCYSASPRSSSTPNYMAATASAKARFRSHSAPRQRPHSTPEREYKGNSAKKRLFFPDTSNACNCNVYIGNEQRSTMSNSCCTESIIGDEMSHPSANDLSRWLR